MANQLNLCTSNLTATGTSSCTEFLSHPCRSNINNESHQNSCYFINDHTYTILKKICRRMLKNQHRCLCRENYTIFDGGNSINVRIHRSTSRGVRRDFWYRRNNPRCTSASPEIHSHYDPCRTGQRFEPGEEKSNCVGKSDFIDESNYRKSHNGKNIDEMKRYDNDRRNTGISKTNRRNVNEGFNKDYSRRESKLKSKTKNNSESNYNNDDENYIEKRNRTNLKKRRGQDDDDRSYIDILIAGRKEEGWKKLTKDSVTESDMKGAKKLTKHKRKASRYEDDYDEEVLVKGNEQNGKLKDADDSKFGKGKKDRKSNDTIGNNAKNRKETDEKGRKSKSAAGKQGGKSTILEDNEKFKNIKEKKGYGRETRISKVIKERVVTNLRKNGRRGDNFFLDTNRSPAITRSSHNVSSTKAGKGIRINKQFAESLQLHSKRTDADRACDLWRANMEQREIHLACYRQDYYLQSCLCNPRSAIPGTCVTCTYPSSDYTYCPESYC